MPSVYDLEAFASRVNYAAQCFMRGTHCTRHFDTCFEMYDGDVVVTALVRRADKNPALAAAIARKFSGGVFPREWRAVAETLADVPTRKLADAARAIRETARAKAAASHIPPQPLLAADIGETGR